MNRVEKRIAAQAVLSTSKSDDLKLLEVFELYKDELKEEYSQLYYALLGWRDSHLSELLKLRATYFQNDGHSVEDGGEVNV